MLRRIFNEPKRVDEGFLLSANEAIRAYLNRMDKVSAPTDKHHKLAYWAKSFMDAIDELEQSKYCAEKFSEGITHRFEEEMDEAELDQYHLYLYFYKNALIRVFSILDKLGHYINEWLELRTERVKRKFSYFTVLRHMHDQHVHTTFEQSLYDLKKKYREPMLRLRKKRNMEIHFINVEFLDDMHRAAGTLHGKNAIENPKENLDDLRQGYEMVLQSVYLIFQYAKRMLT
ncbi:Cthe_2314 family HEPN domain-containing protein [Marinicrinis sediminis]|uniref:Cthe_2314 family HEPN domain-containing protein n=1 Tax=Marinicrinis sediminis TaxID=1652465 RepID=A0ABW5R723_9BACL